MAGPHDKQTVPATRYVAVTPNDVTNLPDGPCRALYIGGDGNVVVRDAQGTETTFVGLLVGSILPIVATGVSATGTTATNIVALY